MNFLASYGEILSPILTLVVTITVPVIGAAAVRLFNKMGIDIEAQHREALQSALRNGALVAIEKATGVPRQQGKATVAGVVAGTVASAVTPNINAGIEYVQKSVPDAIAKFDLDPFRIRELLEPHIKREVSKIF